MKKLKVALVHDYIREYGGAERVLKVLSEIYPDAPIYVAFAEKTSPIYKLFRNKKIIQSRLGAILKIWKLYSPLRFLTPWVWGGFDLSEYDLVIISASWYITKGFRIGKGTTVICYCHTPPRNLYGFQTSIKWHGLEWKRFPPAQIYAAVVNHFLRIYDFKVAQKPDRSKKRIVAGVDYFIANSKNVAARIKKFYRRDSKVIYPPIDVETIMRKTKETEKEDFFLIVSRIADSKGLEEASVAAKKANMKLKIIGTGLGFSDIEKTLKKLSGDNVELLGHVSDNKLWEYYAKARGFIALARNEDFGMTPVEATAAGTPVIAFNGGGFKESVIDGKTGILIDDTDGETLKKAIMRFNRIKWDERKLQEQAKKFSKERFEKEIKAFISRAIKVK
jgi:glycosyltransferase involved in cell wall biosynthesis